MTTKAGKTKTKTTKGTKATPAPLTPGFFRGVTDVAVHADGFLWTPKFVLTPVTIPPAERTALCTPKGLTAWLRDGHEKTVTVKTLSAEQAKTVIQVCTPKAGGIVLTRTPVAVHAPALTEPAEVEDARCYRTPNGAPHWFNDGYIMAFGDPETLEESSVAGWVVPGRGAAIAAEQRQGELTALLHRSIGEYLPDSARHVDADDLPEDEQP